MKQFKLYAQGCSDDELELQDTFTDEIAANVRALDLYHRGWRTVKVIKPDGTESMLWCKPDFNKGGAE